MYFKHDSIPPEFSEKKKYLCSECPDIYFDKHKLRMHINNHKREYTSKLNQYECKQCDITITGRVI